MLELPPEIIFNRYPISLSTAEILYNDLGKINELRIGETLFRGVDTTTNQAIAMLYHNMLELPPEIIFNRYPISLSTAETNRLIIKISSSL
jgi:predicted amino acid racemase